MAINAFQGYTFRGDSEARTAGFMPVFGGQQIENTHENIKGPSFSDHLNAAAYHPDNFTDPVSQSAQDSAKSAGGVAPFTFWDLIDVLNPLQHIPVVSTIYRHLTGDEIRDSARLVGDALYGGPIGAAAGLVDIAFKNSTGKDAGETVMAFLAPGDKNETAETMVADNGMSAIAPAAGPVMSAADIIWDQPVQALNDIQSFLPPGTPTEYDRTPVVENSEPAAHTQDKDGRLLKGGTTFTSLELKASDALDSPSFPIMQDAPAEVEEHDIPPALIAEKMMRALDAYGAMKRQGL